MGGSSNRDAQYQIVGWDNLFLPIRVRPRILPPAAKHIVAHLSYHSACQSDHISLCTSLVFGPDGFWMGYVRLHAILGRLSAGQAQGIGRLSDVLVLLCH